MARSGVDGPRTTAFTLNGRPVEVRSDHPHLLAALREELDVTSPKDGCSPSGQCGCCTVLLDDRATVACQVSLARAAGKFVVTLEGFDRAERARYAAAFAATGALQCGFCTPGIVVRLKALLDRKGGRLSREEASRHLGAHLCRCTGYAKILDAVEVLANGQSPTIEVSGGIGARAAKYDSPAQALGEWGYVDDLRVPGMLHGALRLAAHARAEIVRLDTSRRPGRAGSRGGPHRRRRPRGAARRDRPAGLAGLHPRGRPHLLSRRRARHGRRRHPADGAPRRRARRGRVPPAATPHRPRGGHRRPRGRRLAVAGQRALAIRLPPRRRRRGARRLRAHRPRGLLDPTGGARLPRTRVHPRRSAVRRHAEGLLGGSGRLGRPAPDRLRPRRARRTGPRRAGRQRRCLRGQGGPLEPGPDGARRLVAAASGEVHPVPGGVVPPPPETPPVPDRVLGGLRHGGPAHGPQGPHDQRHGTVCLGRPARPRTRRRPRLGSLRRPEHRDRGRRGADEQPRLRRVPRLRGQPGPVRHGRGDGPPRRAGGDQRVGDAGPQRRHPRCRLGSRAGDGRWVPRRAGVPRGGEARVRRRRRGRQGGRARARAEKRRPRQRRARGGPGRRALRR